MSDDIGTFLGSTAVHLGVSGDPIPFGATSVLRCTFDGRRVDLASSGDTQWVRVDVRLLWFPDNAEVSCAPAGTVGRAKLIEERVTWATTGDPAFDAQYLILGAGAKQVASLMSVRVRSLLIGGSDLRPDLSWTVVTMSEVEHRLHLRAQAPVPSGSEAFSHVARRAIGLAHELELVHG